jgi:hypothetical protein
MPSQESDCLLAITVAIGWLRLDQKPEIETAYGEAGLRRPSFGVDYVFN